MTLKPDDIGTIPPKYTFGRPQESRQSLIYSDTISFVNRRRARACSFVLAALLSTGMGCAITGHPPAPKEIQLAILAVYEVEPVRVRAGPEHFAERLQADFGTLSKLGFDAILVRQIDAEQTADIKTLAANSGMTAVMEDSGPASSSSRRMKESRGGPARVHMGNTKAIESALADRLLWQYHQELSRGRTDGLLIDGFCALPGDGLDLASIANGSARETVASLSATLSRAKVWQTRLKSAELVANDDVKGPLQVSDFRGHKCRFVLVFNPSLDKRIRADVELAAPGTRLGEAASAVEIPGALQQPAGRVVRGQSGSIRTNFDLPPGEAALFELF